MRLAALALALMLTSIGAFCSENVAPAGGCSDLRPGTQNVARTKDVRVGADTIFATVALSRSAQDKKGVHCKVVYTVYLTRARKTFPLFRYRDETESDVGIDVTGLSPNKRMFAANLWWAAGDFTAVRPVVIDLGTGVSAVKELGGRITSTLPSCDYFQEITGVTDAGEVIVHVPQSAYVDKGCPDQGAWLFNLKTNVVTRVKK